MAGFDGSQTKDTKNRSPGNDSHFKTPVSHLKDSFHLILVNYSFYRKDIRSELQSTANVQGTSGGKLKCEAG